MLVLHDEGEIEKIGGRSCYLTLSLSDLFSGYTQFQHCIQYSQQVLTNLFRTTKQNILGFQFQVLVQQRFLKNDDSSSVLYKKSHQILVRGGSLIGVLA